MNQSWEFGNSQGLHMFSKFFWTLLSFFVCIWIKRIDMRGKQWTLTPIRSVLTPDWCLERSVKKLQEKADEATLASEKDIKWKISLQKNMLIKIFKYVTLFLHKYFHICKQIHACFLAYIKFTQKNIFALKHLPRCHLPSVGTICLWVLKLRRGLRGILGILGKGKVKQYLFC